jgi:hypothetical protein
VIEARAGAKSVRPTLPPFHSLTQLKMPRLSIATPLRSLRAAAARPSAATRFAAPAVSKAFHLSARSTAPAAADAVKSAGAPALNTTGQPIADPMTGEVSKNADIDVSPRVCPFDGRKVEGETACRSSPVVAADGEAEALEAVGPDLERLVWKSEQGRGMIVPRTTGRAKEAIIRQ